MNEKLPSKDVAMSVIRQGVYYIFERRTKENNNGAIGLIGCFGGLINPQESAGEAAARELKEEAGLVLDQKSFKQIGGVDVVSDRDGVLVNIHAEVFEVTLPYGFEVRALNSVTMTITDISLRTDELTPATREAFKKYYLIGE